VILSKMDGISPSAAKVAGLLIADAEFLGIIEYLMTKECMLTLCAFGLPSAMSASPR
jgi:hypothetical protein